MPPIPTSESPFWRPGPVEPQYFRISVSRLAKYMNVLSPSRTPGNLTLWAAVGIRNNSDTRANKIEIYCATRKPQA
jgi:hypothetical protein